MYIQKRFALMHDFDLGVLRTVRDCKLHLRALYATRAMTPGIKYKKTVAGKHWDCYHSLWKGPHERALLSVISSLEHDCQELTLRKDITFLGLQVRECYSIRISKTVKARTFPNHTSKFGGIPARESLACVPVAVDNGLHLTTKARFDTPLAAHQ